MDGYCSRYKPKKKNVVKLKKYLKENELRKDIRNNVVGKSIDGGWGDIYFDLTGTAETAFVFNVKTDNTGTSNDDQFTLPLVSSFNGVTAEVDWGDGSTDTITAFNQPEVTHTYASAGTYTIKISNALRGFRFDNGRDKLKLLNISNWGVLEINEQ